MSISFNSVHLMGTLTRDVEMRNTATGFKVAKFGFVVTGVRRKNQMTGKWEDDPCFLDVTAFNKTAEICEQYAQKGTFCLLDGHLQMDSWTAPDGTKRNKLFVVADSIVLIHGPGERRDRIIPPQSRSEEHAKDPGEDMPT